MDTYYTVLGVSETASDADIKEAYRELIRQFHPDSVPTASAAWLKVATDKTAELNEAYTNLSKFRHTYDAQIAAQRPKPVRPTPTPQPAPQTASSGNPVQPQPPKFTQPWKLWIGGLCGGLGLLVLILLVSNPDSPSQPVSQPAPQVVTPEPPKIATPLPAWTPILGETGLPNAGLRFINKPGKFYRLDYCSTGGYGIPFGELDEPENRLDDPACRIENHPTLVYPPIHHLTKLPGGVQRDTRGVIYIPDEPTPPKREYAWVENRCKGCPIRRDVEDVAGLGSGLVVGKLSGGERVEVLNTYHSYYSAVQIKTDTGVIGWIDSDKLTEIPPPTTTVLSQPKDYMWVTNNCNSTSWACRFHRGERVEVLQRIVKSFEIKTNAGVSWANSDELTEIPQQEAK